VPGSAAVAADANRQGQVRESGFLACKLLFRALASWPGQLLSARAPGPESHQPIVSPMAGVRH